MDASQAWQSVLGQLQMEMPRASFDTWIRDTKALSIEDGLITISTRNAYARDWLESRLKSTVSRLLVGILRQSVDVEFVVQDLPDEEPETTPENDEPEVTIEPVRWLDYDKIVQPHKQVVVNGYLRRLGMEIGPKATWLYIGFHQAAWRANNPGSQPLFSEDIMRFSGLSSGAFWRLLHKSDIQTKLHGLVERIDPLHKRRYRRGRDGRPHRSPVRYQVCMTPRLTHSDSEAVYGRLIRLIAQGCTIAHALKELLELSDVMELLAEPNQEESPVWYNTIMDMIRSEAGEAYSAELDRLAQELHRRIINCLGDIHIPHFFITQTIQHYNLTPAQSWLITVARDMAYINPQTGERRDVVTFKRGYREMAEIVSSRRYKTIQAWFNPQWEKQSWGGNMSRFLSELELADEKDYADLRTGSMPRTYRVLLDEPLDANGSNRPDADGNNSRTRLGVLVDANGGNMADANGTALNSFKHPLNTNKNNTSSTRHSQKVAGTVPAYWELKTLFQQNNVHPKVQRELLESNASVQSFVAWILFAVSPQGKRLSDPLGYAISQLRQDPLGKPPKSFHQFANLPPVELMTLIDATPTQRYEFKRPIQHPLVPVWKKAMGSSNPRLMTAREILFGESVTD